MRKALRGPSNKRIARGFHPDYYQRLRIIHLKLVVSNSRDVCRNLRPFNQNIPYERLDHGSSQGIAVSLSDSYFEGDTLERDMCLFMNSSSASIF